MLNCLITEVRFDDRKTKAWKLKYPKYSYYEIIHAPML